MRKHGENGVGISARLELGEGAGVVVADGRAGPEADAALSPNGLAGLTVRQ